MDPNQNNNPNPAPQNIDQQVAAKLKGVSKVLVTVSKNPSVDQLAAAIGFTLVLNKLKKQATAVFSGEVPSILEFLQPDKTLEKNTDSLQDFIIALDKAKADKLRYKIEDDFVKIFITPYHTTISEKDLEFSHGELNVEAVVALGVHKREELDQAITAHGRILHDATVISINNQQASDIGTLNWAVPEASSLCEIIVGLAQAMRGEADEHLFDEQMATALLTGIVSETDRFSNGRTTPKTMNTASVLMKAGANQQLIASKLEEPDPIPPAAPPVTPPKPAEPAKLSVQPAPDPQTPATPISPDGSLTIAHSQSNSSDQAPEEETQHDEILIDDEGTLRTVKEMEEAKKVEEATAQAGKQRIDQAPSRGGTLNSGGKTPDENATATAEAMSLPSVKNDDPQPPAGLSHSERRIEPPAHEEDKPIQDDKTLEDIEESVNSPHLQQRSNPDVEAVRQKVEDLASQPQANPFDNIASQVPDVANEPPATDSGDRHYIVESDTNPIPAPPRPQDTIPPRMAPPPVPPPISPPDAPVANGNGNDQKPNFGIPL